MDELMFGRAMSSPPRRDPLPVLDGPPPAMAVCKDCETPVILAAGRLPHGWTEVEDRSVPSGRSARCTACSAIGTKDVVEGTPPKGSTTVMPGCIAIDDPMPALPHYVGCRIAHWAVGGNVVLRIHGGAAARSAGHDRPVHFLATPEDLDVLIIHLAAIRASLRKQEKN